MRGLPTPVRRTATRLAAITLGVVIARRFTLDTKVTALIPDFAIRGAGADQLTVRHLLEHSSGIPDVTDYEWEKPSYDAGALRRFVATLKDSTLQFAPGTAWDYSNTGFPGLGALATQMWAPGREAYVSRDSVLCAATACRTQAQGVDSVSPPHRRHHALTYDPTGKRVLLFGGQHLVTNNDAPMLSDLWSWNGRQWTQLAANSGVSLIAHQLFASSSGIFVLANRLGLTARWDGQLWVSLFTDSATRREMAAGAFDDERNRFVLFGGHVDGRAFPRDTWEFDGHRWIRMATDGPPAMFGGAMAFDRDRHVMVLFGGLDSTGHKLGDTWEWNGVRWSRAAGDGPSPRFGHGMAYDKLRHEAFIFGGVDSTNQKLNDSWRWNGHRWQRVEVAVAPAPRSEGHLAYDDSRGVIVMFGGEGAQTIPTLNDTWEWNGARWSRVR